LRALNDSFTLIIDEREEKAPPQTFQVLKVNNFKSNVFRDLQIIFDFFQKTEALCLCNFIDDDPFDGIIDLVTFRNLRKLEVQKISIKQVIGIQQLRAQIQEVVCVKCITNVKELLVDCGGDHSNSFIWNELRKADFSFNSLHVVDSSFEFTPYVQNLNLSHNKIVNVSAIKWLPNLKVLNLSFNQLTHIPKFNLEAYRKLQVLIINDNFIEDVSGLTRLDALTELDLSGNCLLDHSILLPLSSLSSLTSLNLSCNPLGCHPKHRVATCRYLNKNAANGKFLLDEELLSKKEKSLAGAYEHYFPLYGNRFSTQTPSLRSRCDSNISTNSFTSINSASDLQSQDTSQEVIISRRVKPRSVVIEDLDNQKNATKIESILQVKNDRKIGEFIFGLILCVYNFITH
jgi:Leucine-rich repeat (LRR) protein